MNSELCKFEEKTDKNFKTPCVILYKRGAVDGLKNVTCDEIYLQQSNSPHSLVMRIILEPSLNTGLQISICLYELASLTVRQRKLFMGRRSISHIMLSKIGLRCRVFIRPRS
jgi:hypothetical protein